MREIAKTNKDLKTKYVLKVCLTASLDKNCVTWDVQLH